MTVWQKIFEMERELSSSEEFKVVCLCRNLKTPLQIFNENYKVLEDHFENHQRLDANKSLLIGGIKNRIEITEYMKELNRLIYNYVAATQTLIDLQRHHYNCLHKAYELFPEYQSRIDSDFKNNPLCRFIQDLRNCCLHKGIPGIYSTRVLDGITEELTVLILLDKTSLLTSFDWNAESVNFINSLTQEICLSEIFKRYHKHVTDFQEWYRMKEEGIFHKQFEFVKMNEKEIMKVGIEFMFDFIRKGRGISRNRLEQCLMRFADYEDSKNIFETIEPKERGQKLISLIKNTIEIPVEILTMILFCYDCFE